VERATGLEFPACFLELDATTDHLNHVGACDEVVNEILRNKSGHVTLNASSVRAGLSSVVIFTGRMSAGFDKHSGFIRNR
jgi:hypothetical protein